MEYHADIGAGVVTWHCRGRKIVVVDVGEEALAFLLELGVPILWWPIHYQPEMQALTRIVSTEGCWCRLLLALVLE